MVRFDYRFNPTLVRLRPGDPLRRLVPAIQFQSHAGSIEAPGSRGDRSSHPFVSIPRWFD